MLSLLPHAPKFKSTTVVLGGACPGHMRVSLLLLLLLLLLLHALPGQADRLRERLARQPRGAGLAPCRLALVQHAMSETRNPPKPRGWRRRRGARATTAQVKTRKTRTRASPEMPLNPTLPIHAWAGEPSYGNGADDKRRLTTLNPQPWLQAATAGCRRLRLLLE